MIVKKLSVSEVDLIIELYANLFCDGWNKDMFISSFNGGRFLCLGAFNNESLVGVITLTLGLDDADIESVFTAPKYRKQGVADLLIDSALEQIKNQGLNKVLLEVRESNSPAKNLYFKHGFKEISIRKKYYSDGENAVILIKEF